MMDSASVRLTQSGFVVSCHECKQRQTTKGTKQLFLKAVSIWINKPHVVNRRLCGSKIIKLVRVSSKEDAFAAVYRAQKCPNSVANDSDIKAEPNCQFTDLTDETGKFSVIFRELVPKSEFFPTLLEAVVYDDIMDFEGMGQENLIQLPTPFLHDRDMALLTFIPVGQNCDGKQDVKVTEELKYCIKLVEINEDFPAWAQINEIEISWSCDHDTTEEPSRQISSQWLGSTLLKKLVSWSEVNDISTSVTSLQLVAVDKYKETYVRLKNTYGRDLVKNWTERTDPKKFVYEDVAIAAYLLLIWEEDREKKKLTRKQSFVDLGCGNGLLVYILTKEGHKGHGIDLRRRRIWDTFGPDIDLREETISPSADHLYPECDWIIGNHSDELTPWIPVIAARSSYECCFFVLPCCHHDFVGKFSLVEKGKSRYCSYLDYVGEIVSHCGFYAETDTLRIPSTKRICYIGRRRSYNKKHEAEADIERQAFIDKRTVHIESVTKQQQSKRPRVASVIISTDDSNSSSVTNSDTLKGKDAAVCGDISDATHSQNSVTVATDVGDDDVVTDCAPVEDSCSPTDDVVDIGDKRKCEYLDSGFSELLSAEELGIEVKKFKSDCDSGLQDSESSNSFYKLSQKTNCSHHTQQKPSPDCASCPKAGTSLPSCQTTSTNSRTGDDDNGKTQQWAQSFKPRIEPGVRNCQTVPDTVKTRIVNCVFGLVLHAPSASTVKLDTGSSWRKGGSVPLGDVAAMFDKSTLQELKSECGGLQTLLRNHSHIFQVTGGEVQLRDFSASNPWKGCNPKKVKNTRKGEEQDKRKTTLCWFDANHPDGCPRSAEDCLFAHGIGELREKISNKL